MRWAEELLSYNFIILYYKELENGRADALSQKANYFKGKKSIKHLILRINKNGDLSYNHIVLAATFRVKNENFTKRLRTAI